MALRNGEEISGKAHALLELLAESATRRAQAEAVIDALFRRAGPGGHRRRLSGIGKSRATHYRRCQPPRLGPCQPRSTLQNALSEPETAEVLALLRCKRFVDLAPARCGRAVSFARGSVGEASDEVHAVEWAVGVLIEATNRSATRIRAGS
jgi:hypothetical protein